MAVRLGARIRTITIDPAWDDGPARFGDARIEWPAGECSDRELREKMVMVALAGAVAEMIYSGQPYHPGFVAEWAADWAQAWEASAPLYSDEVIRLKHLEEITVQLYKTMGRDDHWAALAAIVDDLQAHETLEGEQVEEIVSAWLP
ncbi:MAG: hypothetical protein CMJ62_00855 [Planctomycetaceae bacterium]|nr:hypothetical protein [Planctomycetaceae bacterium]